MKRKVLLGTQEYWCYTDDEGNEFLECTDNIKGKEIKVIIKGGNDHEESKRIEKFVIDELSELFIKRKLREWEENHKFNEFFK